MKYQLKSEIEAMFTDKCTKLNILLLSYSIIIIPLTVLECILTRLVRQVGADVGVKEACHPMKLAVTGVIHPVRAAHDLVVTYTHGDVPADALSLAEVVGLTDPTDVTQDVLTRIWRGTQTRGCHHGVLLFVTHTRAHTQRTYICKHKHTEHIYATCMQALAQMHAHTHVFARCIFC